MKAVIIHAPHDLRVEDRQTPVAGPGQVQVRIRAGGICGSDLHYYHQGGFGTVRIKQPMTLGHEIAGTVSAVGEGVTRVKLGQSVAVNPSLPCNACRFCLAGQQQHCLDMRFYGSAMRFPHIQGGFSETLVCEEIQAVPADMPVERAAFAEPLAVCLHAAHQAGNLAGQRVLITGAGPIGHLLILVARNNGAAEIVATDLTPEPLAMARRLGADHALDMRTNPDALAPYTANKGTFDTVFEASGSGIALAGALTAIRPGGTLIQVGMGPAETPVPLNTIVAKEITYRGTFRFHHEFEQAVALLASGRIDVAPLLTEIIPIDDAIRAFTLASDRSKAMKVQLSF